MNILPLNYLSTNYYLLGAGNSRLLVDAGWPGTLGKFLHILRARNVRPEEISWFVVTHFHPDHAGLTQELKEMGLKLIVLEQQLPGIPLLKQWIKPGTAYKEILSSENVIISAAGSRAFLSNIGIAGQLVPTPGHSDDSITLVLDSGEAFTGDLPFIAVPEKDQQAVHDSWGLLRSLGVKKIYPGHGNSFPLSR
jgi:ribonuclease/clavin/mitogillin